MKTTLLVRAAFFVVLAFAGSSCDGETKEAVSEPAGPPNVVIIVIDTLRPDHLSQYGYSVDTSPGLDRFASQATRFTNARAPSPWTKPSVGSLLSGLVPARHGAVGQFKRLPLGVDTLSEHLKGAGWKTAAFSDNPFISKATYFDQGFDAFYYRHRGVIEEKQGEEPKHRPTHLFDHTELMFEQVRDWISLHESEPFFVYVQPMNVHGPYWVPSGARKRLLGRPPITGFVYYKGLMHQIMNRGDLEARARVGQSYLAGQQESYDTAVRFTSDVISDLFGFLSKRDLYDNTLIIITSDHGEEMFDHGGFGHAWNLYEEVLAVPLLIKLPGQRKARVVDDRVSLLDLVPTIMRAVNLEIPKGLDGVPLQPLLSGESKIPARDLYFSTQWKSRCIGRAVLSDSWKLVEIERNYESDQPRVLLFDIAKDPEEKVDLAAEYPEVVARLRSKLQQRFDHYEASSVGAAAAIEEVDEEALRALGYIE